jgi:hypothetical protein
MQFSVESPFASLSRQLYSPQSTAEMGSQGLGQLSRAFNMSTTAKNQPLNRGLSQNVNAMRRGQGTYDAQKYFAPMNQQLQDQTANAQWGHQVNSANAQSGLQGMSRLMQQSLSNQQQNMNNMNILSRLFGGDLFGF